MKQEIKAYDMPIEPTLPDYAKEKIEESMTTTQLSVVAEKYLIKMDGKRIETVNNLLYRVANHVASAEKIYDQNANLESITKDFYEMMSNFQFLPNTPTLMNAGRELGQLSACFVLPVGDSIDEIFEAVKSTALIHKSGGGTGFSFSNLRPLDDIVKSTLKVSSGPLSFMRVFDVGTDTVKQGGARRGANMGVLRVDHPDIYNFIYAKEIEGSYANFNFSVGATDEFMNAVLKEEYYPLRDPRDRRKIWTREKIITKEEYEGRLKKIKTMPITPLEKVAERARLPNLYISPEDPNVIILRRTGEKVGVIRNGEVYLSAKTAFNKIAELSWNNGEPGIIFLGVMNKYNTTPTLGEIEATNPCGEQPLLPYESCNLGSINLGKMVVGRRVDYETLGKVTRKAVRFLDNVIDINRFPLPQIEEMTKANRKIGLGVMGLADMLILMRIKYDSDLGRETAESVIRFIKEQAEEETKELAKKRGAFPNQNISIYKDDEPRRNATLLTIAPTGTISISAGCSSGIETLYNLISYHRSGEGSLREVLPASLEGLLEQHGIESTSVIDYLKKGAHIKDMPLPTKVKEVFVGAHDVSGADHVMMQAIFQKYVDNAVSKTINFSRDTTKEEVADSIRLAYTLGCKGITIYRDKSRGVQVYTSVEAGEKKGLVSVPKIRPAIVREESIGVESLTGKVKKLFGALTYPGGRPREIFLDTNYKMEPDDIALLRALAIDFSTGMREGKDPKEIISGISDKIHRGQLPVFGGGYANTTIFDGIEAILTGKGLGLTEDDEEIAAWHMVELEKIYNKPRTGENPHEEKRNTSSENKSAPQKVGVKLCPLCNSKMHKEGGCWVCPSHGSTCDGL